MFPCVCVHQGLVYIMSDGGVTAAVVSVYAWLRPRLAMVLPVLDELVVIMV